MPEPLSPQGFRVSSRSSLNGQVRLRFGNDQELAGEANDVSLGGIFIADHKPQPVGTILRFEIDLPGATRSVSGFGEVVWIRIREETKDRPPGMGIQFRYLDGDGEALLKEHVARSQEEALRQASQPLAAAPFDAAPFVGLPLPMGPPAAARSSSLAGDTTLRMPAVTRPGAASPDDSRASWPSPPEPDWAASLPERFVADLPPRASQAPPLPAGGAPSAIAASFAFPEPAAASEPEAPPVSETEELPPPASRRPTGLLAALAAVVLLGAGYWVWQHFLVSPPAAPRPRSTASKPRPSPAATTQPVTSPPAAAAPDPIAPPPAVPAEPATQLPATTVASEPAPVETAAITGGPSRLVRQIEWSTVGSETVVTITTDGDLARERVKTEHITQISPREVVKLAGVTAPRQPAQVNVGTAQVHRIRTGDHPELGQLFIVFDLVSDGVKLERVEISGNTLRLVLGGG